MARVVLSKLSRWFQDTRKQTVRAVQDVDLEIADGEFLVLVGPSGCGKSTTLRLIAGLDQATSGSIFIDDVCVDTLEPKDRDVAMVFQNYALYPHFTVYENMAFGLKLRRIQQDEIDRRIQQTARTLGLSEFLNRLPKALSGGQRQRVALGRALVRQPKVFLFDEPLSNLDAQMRVQTRMELARLHHSLKATMIYVTHDQVEAMTLGDRIAVLHEGTVQQVAPPMELYHKPVNQFVAGFIGSPPMNFILGELGSEGGQTTFQTPGLARSWCIPTSRTPCDRASGPVVMGIRPEHIEAWTPGTAPLSDSIEAFADRPCVEGVVELSEPLGMETWVHVRLQHHRLTARTPGLQPLPPGTAVRLRLDMAQCHWFDPKTGLRLSSA